MGAGPAGLEATRALGQRGYRVTLAEAGKALGGRVTRESALPGLGAWSRVRDWRVGRIREMANVDVYLDSELTAGDVLEFGFDRVIIRPRTTRESLYRKTFMRMLGSTARSSSSMTTTSISAA